MIRQDPCVFIALGSNLGDSHRLFAEALASLRELSNSPLRRSSLWKSTPVDCPPGSPSFFNAAVALVPVPGLTPETLLARLQQLEKAAGRQPKKVLNEARPLDLDLIAYNDEIRHSPELTLPHPRAHLRKFVLAPLVEIAPDLILPGQIKTVRELLGNLRTDEIVEKLSSTF